MRLVMPPLNTSLARYVPSVVPAISMTRTVALFTFV